MTTAEAKAFVEWLFRPNVQYARIINDGDRFHLKWGVRLQAYELYDETEAAKNRPGKPKGIVAGGLTHFMVTSETPRTLWDRAKKRENEEPEELEDGTDEKL